MSYVVAGKSSALLQRVHIQTSYLLKRENKMNKILLLLMVSISFHTQAKTIADTKFDAVLKESARLIQLKDISKQGCSVSTPSTFTCTSNTTNKRTLVEVCHTEEGYEAVGILIQVVE